MTTAHRATFNPAVGGVDQGGNRLMVPQRSYSSKDMPSYVHMKERQKGQNNHEDLDGVDYKADLLTKEWKLKKQKEREEKGDWTTECDLPTIQSLDTKLK